MPNVLQQHVFMMNKDSTVDIYWEDCGSGEYKLHCIGKPATKFDMEGNFQSIGQTKEWFFRVVGMLVCEGYKPFSIKELHDPINIPPEDYILTRM